MWELESLRIKHLSSTTRNSIGSVVRLVRVPKIYLCFMVRPRAGGILASVQASSKLSSWLKKINVVAANKVLGQIDDGGHQTLL